MLPSFLSQLDRIARRSYEPSDDDIVRARLRTLGVQENRIKFERGTVPTHSGQIWYLIKLSHLQMLPMLVLMPAANGLFTMLVGPGRW
jgi:hypothetical protein